MSDKSGSLRIAVSESGLPLHVHIAPALLAQGADALAAEVLRLCREVRG